MGKKFQIMVIKEPEDGETLRSGNRMDSKKVSVRWFEYPEFNYLSNDQKRKVVGSELMKVSPSDYNVELDKKETVVVTEQGRHNYKDPRFKGKFKIPKRLRSKQDKSGGKIIG